MKFEQCPSLQRAVIFNCDLPLYAETSEVRTRYGYARVVCFNPRSVPTEFSLEFLNFLIVNNLRNIDSQTLRKIGENANQLQKITIFLENQPFLEELLENGLIPMFKGLSESLRSVCFDISWRFSREYTSILERLQKSIGENCVNLESFHVNKRKT